MAQDAPRTRELDAGTPARRPRRRAHPCTIARSTSEGAVPERPLTVPARPPGRLARVPDVTSVVLTVVAAVSGLTAVSTAARGGSRPSRCRRTCC